jgi:Flp pilus assembly protein TadG
VLPVLLTLLLGFIDLAQWNLQKSQATNAARDGARNALASVAGTDTVGTAANTRVHDAVAARLGGQSFTFTVVCMTSTTTTPKTCAANSVTVDRDRVKVTVQWQRSAMTFVSKWFGASKTVSGSSIMTIDG